jgi:hypothetical protein
MKNEEINRRIAEACGWRKPEPDECSFPEHELKSPVDGCCYVNVPDYCTDLNAMHEAETHILRSEHTDTLGLNYWKNLWFVCGDNYEKITTVAHATAHQRAEAFLRTIGKWEE